jgi:hypothetical protein
MGRKRSASRLMEKLGGCAHQPARDGQSSQVE